MTWRPATERPQRRGQYLVRLEGTRVAVASWLPGYGWWDGYRRLLGVRRWCEIPPDDGDSDGFPL